MNSIHLTYTTAYVVVACSLGNCGGQHDAREMHGADTSSDASLVDSSGQDAAPPDNAFPTSPKATSDCDAASDDCTASNDSKSTQPVCPELNELSFFAGTYRFTSNPIEGDRIAGIFTIDERGVVSGQLTGVGTVSGRVDDQGSASFLGPLAYDHVFTFNGRFRIAFETSVGSGGYSNGIDGGAWIAILEGATIETDLTREERDAACVHVTKYCNPCPSCENDEQALRNCDIQVGCHITAAVAVSDTCAAEYLAFVRKMNDTLENEEQECFPYGMPHDRSTCVDDVVSYCSGHS